MKNILIAVLLAATVTAAQAQTPAAAPAAPAGNVQTPQPADWYSITLSAPVSKPAYEVWDKIGGNDWCGIAKFLDIQSCKITEGRGNVGSTRLINDSIVEIAVARTPYSYTYAQPFTPIFYHGTLAVEALDAGHSKIIYSLMWNQAGVGDAAAQAAARTSRQTRFQAAVDKMAAAANAP